MTTHHFQPQRYYPTLGPHPPALHVQPGDRIVTITAPKTPRGSGPPRDNPLTGPFFIEGAAPEDTLVVHLERLVLNCEMGYGATSIVAPAVDALRVPQLPTWDETHWRIDLNKNTATLERPVTTLDKLMLTPSPMIGCLGVAPDEKQTISALTSGPHGGNMDYRAIGAGVTLYFPVFVTGAFFLLGDAHAWQADGELLGRGIETGTEVEFTVELLKGKRPRWPRGENEAFLFTLGNARPLDQALQHATTEMLHWLGDDYGLDPLAANLLLGTFVHYDLANFCDPAYTMVCKIPKDRLPRRR